jgi:endoglucanase
MKSANGFILLSHIGVAPARTDKFYDYLKELIEYLKSKNYELVPIDELLHVGGIVTVP